MAGKKSAIKSNATNSYKHPTSSALMRPEVGTQAQFRKKKEPVKYRYDSSLDPAMSWDEGNAAREQGEAYLSEMLERISQLGELLATADENGLSIDKVEKAGKELVAAQAAASSLKTMSAPFLNWSGKAEQAEFDVPTLPLFIHERLSTQAIIETLRGHKKGFEQLDLFSDPRHSIADQVLKAYEHRDKWVNRMILGDSLVVMNSLLHYEGMGGQVQMIYMDPPYGVKFGSNFQPFIRKRDVKHNDDDDMTYEPEMVQAYRDTWELGLHSWLTYLRDRLMLCRELLHSSGSIFVQIGDENVHHVREVMDEVFGAENFVAIISFQKSTPLSKALLPTTCDYILFFAKGRSIVKYKQLFTKKNQGEAGASRYNKVITNEGRVLLLDSYEGELSKVRIFTDSDLSAQTESAINAFEFNFGGKKYLPSKGRHWQTHLEGLKRLAKEKRILVQGNRLRYIRYFDDFPVNPINNIWTDIGGIQSRSDPKIYAVQTSTTAIQRCILMTTDPGDLVLDPTCGSGTTAYVAEQWGRRWITTDVSRVPLALARQRLLTATFDYYELKDESTGPASGFVYKRKQNKKGEEVGGIVPHITLKSVANNEPPAEEVLVDRPEIVNKVTRVTGPFVFEATIPTPMDWETPGDKGGEVREDQATFEDRMVEVLRKVKTINLSGNRKVVLKNVRVPAKSLSLSAEALANGDESKDQELSGKPVAFVFGPENGAVSERLVYEAAFEAHGKQYAHLFVVGFGIEPNARMLVEKCHAVMGIAATYVEATRDLMMGDLLKNMRSSQVFSVCGLPEIEIVKTKDGKSQVKLLGLDVFDPISMQSDTRRGDDVPAWFLDTDYNGRVFHVCQAFFPRTGAWDNLKKALKTDYTADVWDHLAGDTSAPFEKGETGRIAVKVIDVRGNELLVVKEPKEAGK
ncbi:MAG: site-specific DNA-methyltransferase [Desulfobacterales bacterium]|nr:site-specific DNA-methyltransferase [Desulfobacterales bacterium]